MRLFLSFLLTASTATAAPLTTFKAPKLGKSAIIVPAAGLLAPGSLPSIAAPVLPTLEGTLPLLETAVVLPAVQPTPVLHRAQAQVHAVPATRTESKEPLLRRLKRGFKNALSLPSLYDGATPAALNAADEAGYKLREKPDRVTPRTAERAALELKLDAEELYVGLREIHDLAARQGDILLRERKTSYLTRLQKIAGGVDAASVVNAPYKAASARLKRLHKERDSLVDAQAQAAKAQDPARLDALNETAIELHRSILKTQLGVSILQLTGKSRLASKAARRNAAIWTLAGAYNSAAALEAEVRYSANRSRLREKRREYLTRDAFGRPVRVFNLEGFDIDVFPPVEGGKPVVTIRQQRWRNVLTNLAGAARDARNGRPDEAVEKLDTITALYTIADKSVKPEVRRDYARIANALAIARKSVAKGKPDASDRIEDIAELLSYPKLSSWKDVAYEGLDKALRSQAHTLTGNLQETTRVLRHLSELEYWRDLLNAALRPAQGGVGRALSKRERTRMVEAMESIRAWAERGKVRPKQEAATALATAADALAREDLVMARERVLRAREALQRRVNDLDSISANVRRRAASLYAEYRDADILARTNKMFTGISKMAAPALALKDEYDLDTLPEPGYKRAARNMDAFAFATREGKITKATQLLKSIREDIEHKRSYRVSVRVRPSKSSRRLTVKNRFVNPGTTLRTVVGRIGGKRDKPEIRIDGGEWLSYSEIPWGMRLTDESVVDLVYPSR